MGYFVPETIAAAGVGNQKSRGEVFCADQRPKPGLHAGKKPARQGFRVVAPATRTPGMRYYGYRYYNPELGRWPSKDPIEELAFRYAAKQRKPNRPSGVLYVIDANNLVDMLSLSMWPEPGPISPPEGGYPNPPPGQCSIRVCCTPVAFRQRHCYIRMQDSNGALWGCGAWAAAINRRGTRRFRCDPCCGAFGPLVTQCAEHTEGGGTGVDRDIENRDQRCRLLAESEAACSAWGCFQMESNTIGMACYVYGLIRGANSNSYAHTLLSRCLGGLDSLPILDPIPLPDGVNAPGWRNVDRNNDRRCPAIGDL